MFIKIFWTLGALLITSQIIIDYMNKAPVSLSEIIFFPITVICFGAMMWANR